MATSPYSLPKIQWPTLPSFDSKPPRQEPNSGNAGVSPFPYDPIQERTSSGTQPVGTSTGLTDGLGGGGYTYSQPVNPFAQLLQATTQGLQSGYANDGQANTPPPAVATLNPTDPNGYQGMNPGEAQRLFRGVGGGNAGQGQGFYGNGGNAYGFTTGGGAIQPQGNNGNPFQWGNQNPLKKLEDAVIGNGGGF